MIIEILKKKYKKKIYKNIGNTNLKCNFCHALKWSKKQPSLCCSEEKNLLAEIADPPEPLNSFLNHFHRYLKHFLDMIRIYNTAFQMTSFSAN